MNLIIAGAVRTAGGSFGGSFKRVSAVDLGALVLEEALRRGGVQEVLLLTHARTVEGTP